MNRILAISDIHGHYYEFEALLEKVKYDPSSDKLVLLGDFVDKGEDSKKTVELAMHLTQYCGAVAIGGNHDALFTDWTEGKQMRMHPYFSEKTGGKKTAESYLADDGRSNYEERARAFIAERGESHIAFLKSLPDYAEIGNFVFAHAGADPGESDWRETEPKKFRWIRGKFHKAPFNSDKIIVFGHTPARFLHKSDEPWIMENKIGIDGGIALGGRLNCLEISDGDIRSRWVEKSVL